MHTTAGLSTVSAQQLPPPVLARTASPQTTRWLVEYQGSFPVPGRFEQLQQQVGRLNPSIQVVQVPQVPNRPVSYASISVGSTNQAELNAQIAQVKAWLSSRCDAMTNDDNSVYFEWKGPSRPPSRASQQVQPGRSQRRSLSDTGRRADRALLYTCRFAFASRSSPFATPFATPIPISIAFPS